MTLRLPLGVDLRPGEHRVTLLMAANVFLLLFFAYLVKPARDAVFLTAASPASLPWVYLLTALVAAPVTAAYARAGMRRRLGRLIRLTTLMLIASLLLMALLLRHGGDGIAYLFYAWAGVATGLTTSQFWLLANAVFDAAQAKRVFPVLSLGAILGAVAGGHTTAALVGPAGLHALDLLPVAAAALGASLLVSLAVWRRWGGSEPRPTLQEPGDGQPVRAGVRAIARSRHLLLTVGVIALTVITASFGDYVFKTVSWQVHPGRDELTAFLGRFYGYMSVASLLVQLLLASRLIRAVGARGALFILPAALTLGAAGMVLVPGLVAAMALRGGDFALRHSLDKTSRELLFLPVPLVLKKRTKVFMDVFADRWARGLAGVLLLACTALWGLDTRGIAAVMLVLLAAWIALAIALRSAYLDAFRRAVVRRDIDPGELRVRLDDDQTVDLLLQSLASDSRRDVLYGLGMLEGARHPRLAPALRPLLVHPSPEVRARALALLAGNAAAEDAGAAREALDAPDLDVRRAAVGLLVALAGGADERRELLGGLLADAPRRRNAALAWLSDHPDDTAAGELVDAELARRVLDCTGETGCEGRRLLAGLSRLPHDCGGDLWDRLLEDPDPGVVAAAIGGVARRREGERARWLLDRLAEPDLRVPARQALSVLAYADRQVLQEVDAFFRDDGAPRRSRALVPRILADVPLRQSVAALERHLATHDPEFRFAVIKALGRLRARHPRLDFDRRAIAAEVRVEADRYVQLARLAGLLPDSGEAAALLRRTLGEMQRVRLESVFRLLGLIYPAQDILGAYHGVVSGRRLARATAQEFLDNLLAPDHRRLVIGLLDDAAASAAWQGAGLGDGVTARSTAEALDHLAADCDPWLAACAIHAGARVENPAAAIHLTRTGDDMLTPIEKVLLLQHVDIFSEVPGDQLAALAGIAREVSVLAGDAVYRTHDRADALYLVVQGRVRLHRDGQTVSEVEHGGTFGTWALFADEPRVMDATAEEDTRLLRIDAAEFTDLLSDDVRFAQGVIRTVTRRLRALAGRAM